MKIRSLVSATTLTLLASATAFACGDGQYTPQRHCMPAYAPAPQIHRNYTPSYRPAPAPLAPHLHQHVPELPSPPPSENRPTTFPELTLDQLKGNEQLKFQNGRLLVFDANGEFIGIMR